MIGALGESFLPDAFFARALNKVSDFEIVFEFEIFFWHCVPGFIVFTTDRWFVFQIYILQYPTKKNKSKTFLKNGDI